LFAQVWVYSLFGLLMVYACIISLAVYIPSFLYLRVSNDKNLEKKTIADSLTVITIGLATPWIFLLIFVFTFLTIPIWANYLIVIGIYMAVFFGAIDLPFYLSMESTKKKKVDELELERKTLVDKINNLKKNNERVAIELNIQRIDRDIEKVKSESSHPYPFLKPLAGFVVVSILDVLVEVLKILFNI